MKTHAHRRALLLVLAMAPGLPVLAAKTEAVTPADVNAIQSLDEIVVKGDRTLSAARKAIIDAEDRFYARYNELNKDDGFDIKCSMVTPTGTHFTYRVCQPRIVDESDQADVNRLLQITNGSVAFPSSETTRIGLANEAKRRALELIKKDPELLRALLEQARLEQHFAALRKEKFKGRWVVWD